MWVSVSLLLLLLLTPPISSFCPNLSSFFIYEQVYKKGMSLFLDIEKSLEEVRPRFLGMSLNLQGSTKEFSYVEEMLKQEKCQFEVSLFSRNECNYYTMSNILLIIMTPFPC